MPEPLCVGCGRKKKPKTVADGKKVSTIYVCKHPVCQRYGKP